MSKKTYLVIMPITGTVVKEVVAESEEKAIEQMFSGDLDISEKDINEWEMCPQIVEGNIFHGMQNEVDVEEEDNWDVL